MRQNPTIWNYERSFSEAKKYVSRSNFKND